MYSMIFEYIWCVTVPGGAGCWWPIPAAFCWVPPTSFCSRDPVRSTPGMPKILKPGADFCRTFLWRQQHQAWNGVWMLVLSCFLELVEVFHDIQDMIDWYSWYSWSYRIAHYSTFPNVYIMWIGLKWWQNVGCFAWQDVVEICCHWTILEARALGGRPGYKQLKLVAAGLGDPIIHIT